MIVLGYVGEHKGEGFLAWAGWAIIRVAQVFYPWRKVTHTEILIAGKPDAATIASATMLDGRQVRIKEGVKLNPTHWMAVYVPDTPERNTTLAHYWFLAHAGAPYDLRGAVGSTLRGFGQAAGSWFCNESCGAAMGQIKPHLRPPAGFIAWCLSLDGARDMTAEFFRESASA